MIKIERKETQKAKAAKEALMQARKRRGPYNIEEVSNTVALLQDAYYGTTIQKEMEAKTIRKKLRKELHDFKEYVREYQEAEGEDREDLLYLIRNNLKPNSPFAAFKRWLVKDNAEYYEELTHLLQD